MYTGVISVTALHCDTLVNAAGSRAPSLALRSLGRSVRVASGSRGALAPVVTLDPPLRLRTRAAPRQLPTPPRVFRAAAANLRRATTPDVRALGGAAPHWLASLILLHMELVV